MDKKTILGIVVVAVLFLGFAYVNTKQQEKYQQEMAAWQAYQDSVAAASRPVVPAADSAAGGAAESPVRRRRPKRRRIWPRPCVSVGSPRWASI